MKTLQDLTVRAVEHPQPRYALLRLTSDRPLPACRPGQFVEVRVDGSPETFLRRPISINFYDAAQNELWLLVHAVGPGTQALCRLAAGDVLNCLFPLGNGFRLPQPPAPGLPAPRHLLVGGGVGTAPLLFLGAALQGVGVDVTFLLGGRSAADILQRDRFERLGRLCVTTEDGSLGTQGFVTNHAVLSEAFDAVATCGPLPMMKAVVHAVAARGIPCEASLENLMACGLGACLCCVEKTRQGNLRVCQDGPVFDTRQLLW